MRLTLKLVKRLSWPYGAILAGILGSGFGTHQVFSPGTDYIVTFQVMEASETRVKRLQNKKQVERFCDWLSLNEKHSWAAEAKKQLELCE